MKPKITKIERTDADVDNSVYEIPVEHTDDYGNLYYTKLTRPCAEYDAEIQEKKDVLQSEIDELSDNKKIQKQIQRKQAKLAELSIVILEDEKI